MSTTVDAIAKAAFDAVSAAITDAVKTATLSDGTSDYSGRVVFDGSTPAKGFPVATAEGSVRVAVLEGFAEVAQAGWTITVGSAVHYVLGVRDVVEAGGVVMANVIASGDMFWQAATFQRKTRTSDGVGGFTDAWATITNAPTSIGISEMSGNERWASDRVEASSKWRAVAPNYTPDGADAALNEADRVLIDGKAYGITFVADANKRGAFYVLDLAGGVPT